MDDLVSGGLFRVDRCPGQARRPALKKKPTSFSETIFQNNLWPIYIISNIMQSGNRHRMTFDGLLQ